MKTQNQKDTPSLRAASAILNHLDVAACMTMEHEQELAAVAAIIAKEYQESKLYRACVQMVSARDAGRHVSDYNAAAGMAEAAIYDAKAEGLTA